MKKLLALLLAIVMVFCLCACGDEDEDEPGKTGEGGSGKVEDLDIEGKWVGTLDLGDALDLLLDVASEMPEAEEIPSGLLDALGGLFDGMEITFDAEFDNGTATFTLDPAELVEDLVSTLLDDEDALFDYMVAYMEVQMDAMGMDKDDFEDEMGMSLEEYVEEQLGELDRDEIEQAMSAQLPKMDVAEGSLEYTLDGDELELVSEEGDGVRLTIDCDGDEITIKDAEAIGEVDDDVPVDAITELFEKITLTRK